MSQWDREFIDLVAPGHLSINANGTGAFAFGAIEAEVDCRIEKTGKRNDSHSHSPDGTRETRSVVEAGQTRLVRT